MGLAIYESMLRSTRPLERSVSKRDQALERSTYAQTCEDALDYWSGGAAQRAHLQGQMVRRLGEVRDPRESPDIGDGYRQTDDGRVI